MKTRIRLVKIKVRRALLSLMLMAPLNLVAQDAHPAYSKAKYPSSVYWGDTHVHTSYSFDANLYGNRLPPSEAYKFARGEPVMVDRHFTAQLDRPLDFLVVADHAENLGVMRGFERQNPQLMRTDSGRRIYAEFQKAWNSFEMDGSTDQLSKLFYSGVKEKIGSWKFDQTVWHEVTAIADQYNDPGTFTTFIGLEWTPPRSMHRVVIFKDDARKANDFRPFSRFDSNDPEDLWKSLADYEENSKGEILAIPHNSNLSQGKMFAPLDYKGRDFDLSYIKTRRKWEPLVEITQNKGDSETHPYLSPLDEFSDYETWDGWTRYGKPVDNTLLAYGYVRSALKIGLEQQSLHGVNPFKFGVIGSTDSHSSLSTAKENNFWGYVPTPKRLKGQSLGGLKTWKRAAAGYVAIWAQENSRESLFAAMKRKEVYASTGPRIRVRFFGGWDYEKNDALKPNLASIGYKKGVPMGGDLNHAPRGKSPNFLIRAVRDPDGANLDRVQVIKGWHDKNGKLHEKIYNVALSDDRKENWKGKVKPVGTTVDIKDASYSNSIGDPELAVVWQDPDFDKDELAFYYVRVLEIPTPRWTAYDAKYFALEDIPEDVPMVTQERAYTSPIWYTP